MIVLKETKHTGGLWEFHYKDEDIKRIQSEDHPAKRGIREYYAEQERKKEIQRKNNIRIFKFLLIALVILVLIKIIFLFTNK